VADYPTLNTNNQTRVLNPVHYLNRF